ncbi:type II CAAX endopeptidase family protein [Pollutibacter soli]|uniref:CPBP family intramembrane glutamic endopeptidase n=1 Tax=Pollutibacter soli TaxID=3034157 RepID=UPI0030140867
MHLAPGNKMISNGSDSLLYPFWNRLFSFNWKFSLGLALLICIPRFFLVLQANEIGNYNAIGIIMVLSALTPFLFLTRNGRREAGIVSTKRWSVLLSAFAAGLGFAVILHFSGMLLYGNTESNWYNYIGRSYRLPENTNDTDKLVMFAIFAITGMSFSPVGEEFFFRAIVHTGFAKSMNEKKASVIDSLLFAFTHLAHFGIVFINERWHFLFVPALIWVGAMYLVSRIFFYFKEKATSIWGTVICHAGFNLGMIGAIFYL